MSSERHSRRESIEMTMSCDLSYRKHVIEYYYWRGAEVNTTTFIDSSHESLTRQAIKSKTALILLSNLAAQDILRKVPSAELLTRNLTIRHHFVADLVKIGEVIIKFSMVPRKI
jgi:hypothetical protein